MNFFKNVYKIITWLTIIAYSVMILSSLGAIKEESLISSIGVIIASLLIISFYFSRTANVIANKKHEIIGYAATAVGLIFLILTILSNVILVEIPELLDLALEINNILHYVEIALSFFFVIVLIYEIEPASHGHEIFQNIIALIVAITFIFPYAASIKNIESESTLYQSAINFAKNASYKIDLIDNYDVNKISLKIYSSLYLISFTGFIINPMFRTHHDKVTDKTRDEIDEIIRNADNIYKVNQPQYQPQSYQQQNNQPMMPQQITQPQQVMPAQPIPVGITPAAKVVNPTFVESEIPDAIIPSVSEQTNSIFNNSVVEPTPVVESTPMVAPTPVVESTPMAAPTPVVEPPTIPSNINQ